MTFSIAKLMREPRASPVQKCDMCATPLEEPHGHLVDTADRKLVCSCFACTMLFEAPGAARGRFKVVPKRYAAISAPLFTDAQWDALGIPIGLAFVFENSDTHRPMAFYPSPAGATESQLPLEAWDELRGREPLIASMKPDVEAALVYRPKNGDAQAYVVPIDKCYELVGLIRSQWTGIQGGDEVHAAIDSFFARIRESTR